jgi:hypothetical protein
MAIKVKDTTILNNYYERTGVFLWISYLRKKIILLLILGFATSCSKEAKPKKVTFDYNGKETKECTIRAGDGRGPYLPLGRMNERECYRKISKKCKDKKFKQVHRREGHFARGKFGSKIMIGLCK